MLMAKQVLVIYGGKSRERQLEGTRFNTALQAELDSSVQLAHAFLNRLVFCIENGQLRVIDALSGRDIKEFDLVWFKAWRNKPEMATAAADYLHHHNVKLIGGELAGSLSQSKLTQYVNLALAGLPVPNSWYAKNSVTMLKVLRESKEAGPFIIKGIRSAMGQHNYLVDSFEELEEIIAANPTKEFIIQEYIPNDFDYRLLVLGGEVKLVIKRTRQNQKSHVNNTSRGGEGELVNVGAFDKKLLVAATAAAKALRREVAGVDIIIDKKTQEYYILEVNKEPQLVGGANVSAKLAVVADYLKGELK
jgi:glutathione synthase/RimK-type ligase-like ATP-grasp enzyme